MACGRSRDEKGGVPVSPRWSGRPADEGHWDGDWSREVFEMGKHDRTLEVICTVLELKEKKLAQYAAGMKACRTRIGVETFKLLHDTETEHINHISKMYEELKRGEASPDACRLHKAESPDWNAFLLEMTSGKPDRESYPEDIAAIEASLRMEGASIEFYKAELQDLADPVEREFLQHVLDEEWERFILLDDLRFYYVDSSRWFIEKGRPIQARADAAT